MLPVVYPRVAFQAACECGRVDIVKAVLKGKKNVDIHRNREAGFRAACANGHAELVTYLLTSPWKNPINVRTMDQEAFLAACEDGHLGVVRVLLALQGDQRIQIIDSHSYRVTAFQYACSNGHLPVVQALLALEGDRRIDGPRLETGFKDACSYDEEGVVRAILALPEDRLAGVRCDAGFEKACRSGHTDVIRAILQSGRVGAQLVERAFRLAHFNRRWDSQNRVMREILSRPSPQAPAPAVIRELGLVPLRNEMTWTRRSLMVQFRKNRVDARRAAKRARRD